MAWLCVTVFLTVCLLLVVAAVELSKPDETWMSITLTEKGGKTTFVTSRVKRKKIGNES